MVKYSDALKSPKWQKKRLEILSRDEWSCRFCHNTENQLQVHHLIYLSDCHPWEYPNEYLITLCCNCHADEEKLKDEDKFLIGNIVMAGISRRNIYILASSLRSFFNGTDKVEKFYKLNDFLTK